MAYFAELNSDSRVLRVIVADDSIRSEPMHVSGEEWCKNLLSGFSWKETSKDNLFRKRFATIGGTYDVNNDWFVDKKPYESWSLDSNGDWQPPFTKPQYKPQEVPEGNIIFWDEENKFWRTGYENENNQIIKFHWSQTDNDWIRE
jgi:hypothetical protein